MKKIIIFTAAILCGGILPAISACPISQLGLCKTEVNRPNFGNTNLQDKMIPNRMNSIKQPNSALDNRTYQGQQQTPNQTNRELIQQESTQPYNANCQFGNCMNRTNPGINNKN